MTYLSSALYVSGSNPERSLAVGQVFSKFYKKVVAGLRLQNEVYINFMLNANNGTISFVSQTVDSNNDVIDLETYGKHNSDINYSRNDDNWLYNL